MSDQTPFFPAAETPDLDEYITNLEEKLPPAPHYAGAIARAIARTEVHSDARPGDRLAPMLWI